MKTKELYTMKEVADLYGKDESRVRRALKDLELEIVRARRSEDNRPVDVITQKVLDKLAKTLNWDDESISDSEITVVAAMTELGLNLDNHRKTFMSKLKSLKIKTTSKNVGAGKPSLLCFDKKHMKELRELLVLPTV